MITRKDLVNLFRCYNCNKELSDDEIRMYSIFDGMCEDCYANSMEAAYDDEVYKDL